MEELALHRRLASCTRFLGDERRTLVWGDEAVALDGLSAELAAALDLRFGPFLSGPGAGLPGSVLQAFRGGRGGWLDGWAAGQVYRIEAVNDPARRVVASHHFALGRDTDAGPWRLGVTEDPPEPLDRIIDNALRYVIGVRSVERGGFPLHAAGVVHRDRAYLFAGPSGVGKTTAARLAAPARSLGDDFGVVLLEGSAWCVPALPFDNSERIDRDPPRGLIPLEAIWRLHQAGSDRVERPLRNLATASLMACAAFPWAMPERAAELLDHVGRVVSDGRFGHLHFTRDADLWTLLI